MVHTIASGVAVYWKPFRFCLFLDSLLVEPMRDKLLLVSQDEEVLEKEPFVDLSFIFTRYFAFLGVTLFKNDHNVASSYCVVVTVHVDIILVDNASHSWSISLDIGLRAC